MTNKLKSLFKLPTPVELGMSKHNALGMRAITPFQKGFTWEDWREKVKSLHPMKYFIIKTLGKKINLILNLKKNFIHFLKCHLHPKHRYHFLDLRNVDPCNPYKYGYLTPGAIIRLSAWKALKIYVESGEFVNPRTLNFSSEEQLEPWFQEMIFVYDESKSLYHYWTVTRLIESEVEDQIYEDQRKALKEFNEPEYRKLGDESIKHFMECQKRENEMFIRLAKIANCL